LLIEQRPDCKTDFIYDRGFDEVQEENPRSRTSQTTTFCTNLTNTAPRQSTTSNYDIPDLKTTLIHTIKDVHLRTSQPIVS
jgi:S-adenosylmethionine synthetase